LLSNGLFEIWFSYREHKTALIRIQREQAESAAAKISTFIREIESQVGWTTQLPWSDGTNEQRKFDGLRLLRQVPAITELAQLDSAGTEQLKVSRLAMNVVASKADMSAEPKFAEAVAKKVYYGPVYFRRESEPYMTLSLAGTRRDAGVSVAEVNLKLIWDVVTGIKVGEQGQAFVIDAQGRLIAHPDISLVLRNTDMTRLTQVVAARAAGSGAATEPVQTAVDVRGRNVLTAYASVAPLGWIIFVELPFEEAYAPLYDAIKRSGALLFAGLTLALLSGVFLARRMVVPIQMLRAGAARIGAGDLTQRIHIKTGDELEGLANQFNDMAGKLEESYAGLEQKVEDRTRELSESLQQQTATSEVLQVISSSPGELEPVFQAMLANATRLCEAKFGVLFLFEDGRFRLAAHLSVPPALIEFYEQRGSFQTFGHALHDLIRTKQVTIINDASAPEAMSNIGRLAGARSFIAVPMLKENELVGAISIYRIEVRPFTDKQIGLVTSFASQAVIAIENVRLLNELHARTDQLAQSVGELRALGEVSQAVNSTLDVETVLNTIVTKAVQLSGTDAGAIYVHDDDKNEFNLRSTYGMSEELIASIREHHVDFGDTVANATAQREPTQIADLRKCLESPVQEIILNAGYRALLVLPLIGADGVVGALVVRRKQPGEFPKQTTDLLQTFAAQSVLAIQNAHLFGEIGKKSHQLEVASQHKSQFLANMSHELRTPLNAILGYTELILDQIYGETPDRMRGVLDRVQSNGKHLLGLINDVLDLSKIEAGQLVLSLTDYSIKEVVNSVFAAVESLANAKKLALTVEVLPDLPVGRGDERRLTQVLLNLVGNAIKFTDTGEVAIKAAAVNGSYTVSVRDTGPGINESDQVKIFEEFQQADSSPTKVKGGTGLGLSIARRIVEMHGGRIWVESKIGQGATFFVTVPVTVEQQVGHA
jgi:signal transduction histidine kinase